MTEEVFPCTKIQEISFAPLSRPIMGHGNLSHASPPPIGSYARGEATPTSDLDVVIVGGRHFRPRDIFALAEDLRDMTGRDADVFELREVDADSPLYETLMREGVRIA